MHVGANVLEATLVAADALVFGTLGAPLLSFRTDARVVSRPALQEATRLRKSQEVSALGIRVSPSFRAVIRAQVVAVRNGLNPRKASIKRR